MSEWRVVGRVGPHEVDVTITAPVAKKVDRSSATKVSSLSGSEVADQIRGIRDDLPTSVRLLADQMVGVFADENKSGKVAESRLLRQLWIPLARACETLPVEALTHGLEVAVAKGVPSVNYAKKAAEGHAAPAVAVSTVKRRVLG